MKKRLVILTIAALPLLTAQRRWDSDWKEQDRETLNRTFKVAAGENASKLIVDNLQGFIHVTGTSGSEIQVKVDKQISAETKEDLAHAKSDVKMDMTQEGNTVKLYENGPFRDRDGGTHWDSDRYRYRVIFDMEVQVPAGVQLELKTLNNDIVVKNCNGDYSVHGLNGKVDMDGIGGTGSVKMLNGSVKVTYTRNPTKESKFDTLNGPIDVYFRPNLDADISFSTMHGGVFSDFDVTALPRTIAAGSTTRGNRSVYRSDGDGKVRAGKGGTALSFHTLNGAIRLHSKS